MGIDIVAGGRSVGHKHRDHLKSENVYKELLVQLYRFLQRRTSAKFPQTVLKRLMSARVMTPPLGLRRIVHEMHGKENKTCVIVGTVTDDDRILEIPKLRICATRFTKTAHDRIVMSGGECLTFDQLAMETPTGSNTVLLRGRRSARVANRYFGIPGTPGSKTRPLVRSEGRKFERARGRRKTCGFKV